MKDHNTFRVLCWLVITLALILPGRCQQQISCPQIETVAGSKRLHSDTRDLVQFRLLRVIYDPGTKQHWLLMEDLSRPSAPALLVEERRDFGCGVREPASRPATATLSFPVIRAGDLIILSEHSRVSDARLEAIALRTAAEGESLTVRMRFGGKTLKAIAVAPGRATLAEEASEGRP